MLREIHCRNLSSNFKKCIVFVVFHKVTPENKPNKFFYCNSFEFPALRKIVAFLYIVTGCDTTLTLFDNDSNKENGNILNLIFDDREVDEDREPAAKQTKYQQFLYIDIYIDIVI